MNKKNLILLQRLLENPRISLTSLSKELNLSKNAVLERIKKLKQDGIYRGSTCILNYFKLGFKQYFIFIKTRIPNLKFDFSKIDAKCVIESISIFGEYNYGIRFISKDDNSKNIFLEDLLNKLDVESYELLNITHYSFLPAKKYFSEPKPANYNISNHLESKAKIDLLDKKILKELTSDYNQFFVDIALKLEISPQLLIYRYKKYLSENIIHSPLGIIYSGSLQRLICFLRFELRKKTQTLNVFDYLIKHKSVSETIVFDHKENFFCTLEVMDRKDIIEFIDDLQNFCKDINSIKLEIFADQWSHNYFPKILEG